MNNSNSPENWGYGPGAPAEKGTKDQVLRQRKEPMKDNLSDLNNNNV